MHPDLWLPCQLLFDKHFTLKRYEVAGRRVLFYFDEVLFWGGGAGRGGGFYSTHVGEGRELSGRFWQPFHSMKKKRGQSIQVEMVQLVA